MGRIVETPMETVDLTREHGAGLVGVAADGDDRVDIPVQELLKVLGGVSGDVDSYLLHDLDRLWMDVTGRLGARAGNLDQVTGGGTKDSFCQVTPAGVAGAEDEDERFGIHSCSGLAASGATAARRGFVILGRWKADILCEAVSMFHT